MFCVFDLIRFDFMCVRVFVLIVFVSIVKKVVRIIMCFCFCFGTYVYGMDIGYWILDIGIGIWYLVLLYYMVFIYY